MGRITSLMSKKGTGRVTRNKGTKEEERKLVN
jgi:hypothetical protein